ncbi:MAG TPA: inorganic diphosphatase [Flavobacteriaceae bacterium]|nr:inorganic diphosphatase [Flavobacteriaceae bacterium]
MNFNPWHDAPIGDSAPEIVEAIIEIPQNSKAKYELDETTGMVRLDRVLYSAMRYPVNYGFIPQTYGEDHDPLDILVLSQVDIIPMCLVNVKVIGVLRMIDDGEPDDKIIAVANDDMSVQHLNSVEELSNHYKEELLNFFEDYKKLERKEVEINGIEDKKSAIEIIERSIVAYREKFGDK